MTLCRMRHRQTPWHWALEWRSRNRLDGETRHWIYRRSPDCGPVMFRTRQAARDYATEHFGYIRERPDLQAEPFGWTVPVPVKVIVIHADG